MEPLRIVAFVAVIGSMFGAVLCWALAIYFMFRTVALRAPGVNIWKDTWLNPFNLLFMSSKLSPAGLVARNRCILGALGFVAFVGLGAVIGALTGVGT